MRPRACVAGFLVMALAGAAASVSQETRPATREIPSYVRYSGSDGVELQYPTTWWRGMPAVREPLPQPLLSVMRSDAEGKSVLTFGYQHLDLDTLPEPDRNAAGLARATVAAAREEDPKRVVQDVTPVQVGAVDGFYFALLRPLSDGRIRLARQWTVTWNDTHFLFSAAAAPEDEASHREFDELMETLWFSPDYRKDDGGWETFHDKWARISLEIPSHWHDEHPSRAMLAEWGQYSPDGTRQSIVRLLSNRLTDPNATAQTMMDALSATLMPAIGEGETRSDVPHRIGDFAGSQRILRGIDKDGIARWVYLVVVQRDDRFIVLCAVALEEINTAFARQWERMTASIRTHDPPF